MKHCIEIEKDRTEHGEDIKYQSNFHPPNESKYKLTSSQYISNPCYNNRKSSWRHHCTNNTCSKEEMKHSWKSVQDL